MTSGLKLYVKLLDDLLVARLTCDETSEEGILEEMDEVWEALDAEDREKAGNQAWRAMPQKSIILALEETPEAMKNGKPPRIDLTTKKHQLGY